MNSPEFLAFKNALERRWYVVAVVVVLGFVLMPFLAIVLPSYKSTAEILIVSQAAKDTTLSDPDLPSIITSTDVLKRVITRLNLNTDPISLAKKIKTKLPPKSSILEISYSDVNASRSAAVANAVADEASKYFHEIAIKGYSDVLSALDDQIRRAKVNIAIADRRLERASTESGFVSSDKALDDLTSEMTDLRAQRDQVSSSLAADQATAAGFKKQLGDIAPIARGEILQKDITYQAVETEVGKDTADLASERASFKDNFPGMSALVSRVAREGHEADAVADKAVQNGAGESPSYTQTVLDSERADGAVAADQGRLASIDSELSDQQRHLREASGAGAAVGTLRAEREAVLAQYTALIQRLSSAQGDAAQAASLGSLVVVSRALPGKSSLWLYLVATAIVALLIGIGLAYLLDIFDRRFWGVREMERVYGRPVLVKVGSPA